MSEKYYTPSEDEYGHGMLQKYLDMGDIELLGWEKLEDRGMSEAGGGLFKMNSVGPPSQRYELRYWDHKQTFWRGKRVEIVGTWMSRQSFFVKSRHELKVLMQQLQIISD